MDDPEKYDLIDQYLKGTLNTKDQTSFDQMIKKPEFKAELEFRTQLAEASRNIGRAELKNRFATLEEHKSEKVEAPISTFIVYRRYIAIAASLAILACAIFLLKPSSAVSSNDALYAANYPVMLNKITNNTRGEASEDSLSIAMTNFDRGDYDEALPIFDAFLGRKPQLKMYLGVIDYENGDYQKALEYWTEISEDEQHIFRNEALWYSAHANYHLGNTEDSIEILKKLSKYLNNHQRSAIDMLSKLKEIKE